MQFRLLLPRSARALSSCSSAASRPSRGSRSRKPPFLALVVALTLGFFTLGALSASLAWAALLMPLVEVQAYQGGVGWRQPVNDGGSSGGDGSLRALQELKLSLGEMPYEGSIDYEVYEQGTWRPAAADGAVAGTEGVNIEAVRLRLAGEVATYYDLAYRACATNAGWLGWAGNGEEAGTPGVAPLEAIQVQLMPKGDALSASGVPPVIRPASISFFGSESSGTWQGPAASGDRVGSEEGTPLQSFKAQLGGEGRASGTLRYRVFTGSDWRDWVEEGQDACPAAADEPIQAMELALDGSMAELYDLWYRVYAPGFGWLGYAKNGESAGTLNFWSSVQAVELWLLPKGSAAPSNADASAPAFHDAHAFSFTVNDGGKGEPEPVVSGEAVGAERVSITDVRAWHDEARLANGSVRYRTYSQGNWSDWASEGSASQGSTFFPVQRLQIELTGPMASYYDLWYRVRVAGVGWMDFARGPYSAGIAADRLGIESVYAILVPKGWNAPGPTDEPCLLDINRYDPGETTPEGRNIVKACFEVPSPGSNLCAMWVSQVINRATGVYLWGNANDMYSELWQTDRSQIVPGMVTAVSTHSHTYMGGLYGHIAIYIGNGLVMENASGVRTSIYEPWAEYYGDRVPVRLGWL